MLSIAILSIVAVASFTGLRSATTSNRSHHEFGVSETLLRTAAESIQDPDRAYVPRAGCPGAGTYDASLPSRAGYHVEVTDVRFWIPGGDAPVDELVTEFSAPGTTEDCPATAAADPGLQLIEITVTASSGQVDRLTVVKRRN